MKKVLKIAGISLGIVILILIILPFIFKGKVMDIVKNEANKMLNAKMEFSGVGLSFIRSFPNATISLDNFCVTGVGEFEGDTLVFAKKLTATANIKSFFKNTGYEISKIGMDKGLIHAIVLENGKVNWDIMKSNSSDSEENGADSGFKLSLENVMLKDVDIFYDDVAFQMNIGLKGVKLSLSGDMTADNTQIETNLLSDSVTFIMDKIPYIYNAKLVADVKLDADFKNSKYTFSDNTFHLNEIQFGLDGWLAMPNETGIEMDIRLNAPKTQFKDVLSMIPAIYTNDFKDVEASGEVVLDAYVKGLMQGDTLPSFDVKIDIAKAKFHYTSLPKSLDNIQLSTHITNPGGVADRTVVDISAFHFEMGGNPFDLKLHLETPVSDPYFDLSAVGRIDLGMIKEIYPLKDVELNGTMNANLKLSAKMSAIEKEQYDRINASGSLQVSNMVFKGIVKDNVQINQASLVFSPKYLDLNNCELKIGKNDLVANGKLENFLPYMLKNETLKGSLVLNSNYLNLNDFMTEDSTTVTKDTVNSGVFIIPKNLDFNLTGNFKQMRFEQLDMANVSGQILIKNGIVDLKNLKMNALGGDLTVNGYYDTSSNPKQPEASINLDIKNASFSKTFASFETVRKFAPVFEAITGNFSTSFQMKTPLGGDFMPVLSALDASGLLQSSSVEVQNVEVLNMIASTLKNESFKDLKIKELKLPFSIDNGRVTTKSFDVNFGAGKMNLSGSTGLDQTIDYLAKVDLPEKLTQGYVNKVSLKIGGTFKSPKISIDAADLAGQALNKLAGSVLGGDESTSASEKVNLEIEKQAESIRSQAKSSGEQLVAEAEKQGQKMIDEANKTKNPLAKAAAVAGAKVAAKKMKDEAIKQSQSLSKEAEKQIANLENNAKSQVPQ